MALNGTRVQNTDILHVRVKGTEEGDPEGEFMDSDLVCFSASFHVDGRWLTFFSLSVYLRSWTFFPRELARRPWTAPICLPPCFTRLRGRPKNTEGSSSIIRPDDLKCKESAARGTIHMRKLSGFSVAFFFLQGHNGKMVREAPAYKYFKARWEKYKRP